MARKAPAPEPVRRRLAKRPGLVARDQVPVTEAELEQEEIAVEDGDTSHPDLEALLEKMARIKIAAKAYNNEADAKYRTLEAKAIDIMHDRGLTKYDGAEAGGTLVEPVGIAIDWFAIERDMDHDNWEQVSTRAGDRAKLDAWIKRAALDPALKTMLRKVTAALAEKPSKPYILARKTETS